MSWRTETSRNARIAIHNLRNGLEGRATVEAELTDFVRRSGSVMREHAPNAIEPPEFQQLLLNVERLLAELKEGDIRTQGNLSTARDLAKGMLLLGLANRVQLFWFDLMWPAVLFSAAFLHFLGHYPRLAFFPSLPEVLAFFHLIPVVR